ncbi:MAG: cytochrome C [Candidatus Electrothrix sp. AR4]|nr:cytochrome C [Candidatus Electrothrix sp. AR4]
MKRNRLGLFFCFIAGLTMMSTSAFAAFGQSEKELKEKYPKYPSLIQWEDNGAPFTDPTVCAGCHPQQYEEWQGSMHSMSFQDPVYLGELNLAVKAVGKEVAKQCEGCHTPAAFVMGETEGEIDFEKITPLAKAGVSCDVCHSIKRHTNWETPSHEPENGSFVLSPGKDKNTLTNYGPFPDYDGCGGGFHDCVESPLHLQADLCASCHQVFHYKEHTPLEQTYAEWKKSPYATKDIACQDCHMVDIKTFKRSADKFQKPVRGEYHHYFNGANFLLYYLGGLQAKKAGDTKLAANYQQKFDMAVERLKSAAEVDIVPVYNDKKLHEVKIRVHNKRAGHNLPTSLTNIRQMWLEVTATDADGKVIMTSGHLDDKGELPENTRLFNSDGQGHDLTFKLDPWDVVSFSRHDTIPPKGYRDVYYGLSGDYKAPITFKAKLRFRQAPQAVAEKLLSNVPKGIDLKERYGITEVPAVPIVDMIDKTVTIKGKK